MNIENIEHVTMVMVDGKYQKGFKGNIKGKPNWRVAFQEDENGKRSPICYFHRTLGGTFVYNQK